MRHFRHFTKLTVRAADIQLALPGIQLALPDIQLAIIVVPTRAPPRRANSRSSPIGEGGRPGPSGQSYFNLRGRPHPDSKLNTKLGWLKRIKEHMALPRARQVWMWFDILSIPQRSRDLQIAAIASLPAYTQLCTR